jgi:hypothetical protein
LAAVKAGVKMYEKGQGTPPKTAETMKARPFSTIGRCPPGWRALYRGEDISRYEIAAPREFVNYGPWLAAPRSPELFVSPKLLMRRTDDRLLASIDKDSAVCVNSCHVVKLNRSRQTQLSELYVLSLLNSKLLQRAFELQNPQMVQKVFAEIKVIYVERLPIRRIGLKRRLVMNQIEVAALRSIGFNRYQVGRGTIKFRSWKSARQTGSIFALQRKNNIDIICRPIMTVGSRRNRADGHPGEIQSI